MYGEALLCINKEKVIKPPHSFPRDSQVSLGMTGRWVKNISLGMTGRWVKNISLGMTQFFILSWKIEEYNSPLALKAESKKTACGAKT